MNKKKIIAFAREPGGADTIAPVVKQLLQRDDVEVELFSKDYAGARFIAAGLDFVDVDWGEQCKLERKVREIVLAQQPDGLLTAASSRPTDDMTEKYFWKVGGECGIPSVAVLDQWQNYAMRFSGPTEAERLRYLPTCIAVMDDSVRRDMISEGIPKDRICVTGHPRFAALKEYHNQSIRKKAREKLARLGVDKTRQIIVFVSEPARRFFAVEEGYDEAETLNALLRVCEKSSNHGEIEVVLKYHPRNIEEDFLSVFNRGQVPLHMIRNEIEPWEVLIAADLVVGMISILLVDSVLLGIPTLSVQLGSKKVGRCLPEREGAIVGVRDYTSLQAEVDSLLNCIEYRARYVERQKSFSILQDGISKIDHKMYELIHKRRYSDG
jgi:hypothetical protein